MIVVDVNIVAYLLIPGKFTAAAERLLLQDPVWAAPKLWRSELRNILANYLRVGQMELAEASVTFQRALELIGVEEYEVETTEVLRLCKQSGCSAYDCEYIAVAGLLNLELVTNDSRLVSSFPQRTRLLSDV